MGNYVRPFLPVLFVSSELLQIARVKGKEDINQPSFRGSFQRFEDGMSKLKKNKNKSIVYLPILQNCKCFHREEQQNQEEQLGFSCRFQRSWRDPHIRGNEGLLCSRQRSYQLLWGKGKTLCRNWHEQQWLRSVCPNDFESLRSWPEKKKDKKV